MVIFSSSNPTSCQTITAHDEDSNHTPSLARNDSHPVQQQPNEYSHRPTSRRMPNRSTTLLGLLFHHDDDLLQMPFHFPPPQPMMNHRHSQQEQGEQQRDSILHILDEAIGVMNDEPSNFGGNLLLPQGEEDVARTINNRCVDGCPHRHHLFLPKQ